MFTLLAVDREVAVADELARLGVVAAKPMRYTTLSRRRSSSWSRFSPVTPFWCAAAL